MIRVKSGQVKQRVVMRRKAAVFWGAHLPKEGTLVIIIGQRVSSSSDKGVHQLLACTREINTSPQRDPRRHSQAVPPENTLPTKLILIKTARSHMKLGNCH